MDIWTQLHYTKEKYDMLMGLIKNPDTNFTPWLPPNQKNLGAPDDLTYLFT